MNTIKVVKDYRLNQWATIVKERFDSKLTVEAFCKMSGISENSFYYWQRKLRESACVELSKSTNNKSEIIQNGFLEAKFIETTALSTPTNLPQHHVNIEIHGARLSASCEYPTEKLVKLLREVARPC